MTAVAVPARRRPGAEGTGTVMSVGGRWGRRLINLAAGIALVYLFLPIFVIVLFSFNKPKGRFNFVWQQFTFDNWLDPFKNQGLVDALKLSLVVAAIATVIATIIGALIAIALVRYRFAGGQAVSFFLILPLTTPEIVLGASLLTLFLTPPLLGDSVELGLVTIVLANVMFCVSYVSLTVKARVRGFDWTLEDAAMDLGASPARTFFFITLPLIAPGILAAALLAFALCIDDFIVTYFVSGSQFTFPIRIFNQSRTAVPPQINVLSSMILFTSVAILGASLLFRRRATT